jgi:hypothetical protein
MPAEPSTVSIGGVTHILKQKSYSVEYMYLMNTNSTVTGSLHYTSGGAWKRKFKVTLRCDNNGVSGGGKAERDALLTLLDTSAALAFIAPDGDTCNVHVAANPNAAPYIDPPEDDGFEYEVDLLLIED